MDEIKVGMIGLDTSHVIAFTELLNNKENPDYIKGAKVIAAFRGGSRDMPLSINRVEGYTQTLKEKYGVEIVDSIEELAKRSDAILLESVDGRVHLEQFKKLVPFGKPVFIDKPFTVSLDEAREIKKVSEKNNIPVFSSSSLRYDTSLQNALQNGKAGDVVGAEAFGEAVYESPTPGLFWYGIHSAEMLFAAMGKGCKSVRCIGNKDIDMVVGVWEDGRVGCLRGIRKGKGRFGAILFRKEEIQYITASPHAVGLMKEVVEFLKTGTSPVPLEETVEIVAFLEGANRSRESDAKEISLE